MRQSIAALALVLGSLVPGDVLAQMQMPMPMGQHPMDMAMTDGEVTKVDLEEKKVTIKHGPMANMNMPGMTMVFGVKEPAMLDQLKTGDKIKFTAERIQGALTVTRFAKEGAAK